MRGKEEERKQGRKEEPSPPLGSLDTSHSETLPKAITVFPPLPLTAFMGQGVISVVQLKGLKPDEGSDSLKVSLLVASIRQSHGLDLMLLLPNCNLFLALHTAS